MNIFESVISEMSEEKLNALILRSMSVDEKKEKVLKMLIAEAVQVNQTSNREKQMEGIRKAKVAGKYKGRKAEIDVAKVKELRDSGISAINVGKIMGISRASVYRVLDNKKAA